MSFTTNWILDRVKQSIRESERERESLGIQGTSDVDCVSLWENLTKVKDTVTLEKNFTRI